MKICFICGEYPPGPHGGIGTMTQVLGRSLTKQGHDVRVVGVYPAHYPGPDFEVDLGVQVWRLRDLSGPGGWIASRYRLYRKVSDWVRAGDVDVVEVPDYQGWAAGWRPLAAPVIARLHGSLTYFAAELHRPIDRISYWLEQACLRRTNYICSVSQYTSKVTEQLFKLTNSSSAILYNAVELPPDVPRRVRTQNRVVFSGTLTAKKGVVPLIQAWPMVVKSYPNAELHIFGKDGRAPHGQSMREFMSSMLNGARPTVHFHGHVSRASLFEAYQTAAVAVFPSYAEAFAIAPLEAMACGCATINSRLGSGPELLEHGRQGLLIDPGDPEQIGKSILLLLTNPALARQMGEAGRTRIQERFSVDVLTGQNLAFYQHCINEFRAHRQSN